MIDKYINTNYVPKKTELLCAFYLETEDDFRKVANHIAGESSIDTWSDIKTLSEKIIKELKPNVYYIRNNIIKIAYPLKLFELYSIPQLLSSVAGNIFGMKLVKNLRLIDIYFPRKYIKSFLGPKFGIKGIRKLINVRNRPLIGTIVKPKLGLSPKEHAEIAYFSWLGGCDLVKDDENLTNQDFNKFELRIKETLRAKRKVEKLTKKKKLYLANITAPTVKEMIARARLVKKLGGESIMVDIFTIGFCALQSLREENEKLNLIIHAHRAMHAAITRNPKHGITMRVFTKIARLIGVDEIHIGTVIGKMEGEKEEVLINKDECIMKKLNENKKYHVFEQDWYNIKPIFPVASGGLQPTMIPLLLKIFNTKDFIMQFGGGIHAHPSGTLAGAKAVKQALIASLNNINLGEYAKHHNELKEAIKKWGIYK